MRSCLLLALLSALSAGVARGQAELLAQAGSTPGGSSASPPVLTYADEMPAYAGGLEALHRYLALKTEYPAEAKRRGLSGTVVVQFVVDEQGRLLDPYVVKSTDAVFDAEAIRLVRLMPWWTPGRQAGQPVRVRGTLPIQFTFKR